MKISIIVAVAENSVIGKGNRLPWHLPDDIKFFRNKTMGHCIISGRINYESIPEQFRPLPGRTNIVLSRDKNFKALGAIVAHELGKAIQVARGKGETECFIIGGGHVFRQAMEMADKIYYTRIFNSFEGDVFFPALDESKWVLKNRVRHEADEKHPWPFEFCEYEKK